MKRYSSEFVGKAQSLAPFIVPSEFVGKAQSLAPFIVLPDISREFLNRMMEGKAITGVTVKAAGGEFQYQFD